MVKKLIENIAKSYINVQNDISKEQLIQNIELIENCNDVITSSDMVTKINLNLHNPESLLHKLCFFPSGHLILEKLIQRYNDLIKDSTIANEIIRTHNENGILSYYTHLDRTNVGQKILRFVEVVLRDENGNKIPFNTNPSNISVESYMLYPTPVQFYNVNSEDSVKTGSTS